VKIKGKNQEIKTEKEGNKGRKQARIEERSTFDRS
jgi:hypothetical protein